MALLDEGDLRARAATIRLAAFDVDGSLTDGRLWFDADGREGKAFHVQDGLGLRLLEENGIAVALITARDGEAVRARGRDLRLAHVFTGVADKRACLIGLAQQLGVAPAEIAYLGDDLPDLPVAGSVGLFVVPADGHAWTREHAHWVTRRGGGAGAARELCDLLLATRGLKDAIVAGYLGP